MAAEKQGDSGDFYFLSNCPRYIYKMSVYICDAPGVVVARLRNSIGLRNIDLSEKKRIALR
jgi:hypothetical protein